MKCGSCSAGFFNYPNCQNEQDFKNQVDELRRDKANDLTSKNVSFLQNNVVMVFIRLSLQNSLKFGL